jgi:hypothetical protein
MKTLKEKILKTLENTVIPCIAGGLSKEKYDNEVPELEKGIRQKKAVLNAYIEEFMKEEK